MRRTAIVAVTGAALVLGAALGALPAASAHTAAHKPAKAKRVVMLVIDGLSQQEIEKYRMTNVQKMMRDGANFPNALVGHVGAVTVVTHNVLTTGVLPQHMGWTDEGYRDVDGVLAGSSPTPDNPYWVTSDLTKDQMFALQKHAGYPKLADYLHAARPGSTVATISPKGYAAWGLGGDGSDIIVTYSGRKYDCDGRGNNWRGPDGVNVPAYLSAPVCGRYYIDSSKSLTYDTSLSPARLYPLDGNRYTVGKDSAHEGSDVWATDAALSVMEHEKNWSGIFLTLPGVDKAAHMWGSVDDPGGTAPGMDPMTHMPNATKVADQQVGRVLSYLKDNNLLDETLVVLTADHGFVPARNFHGLDDGSADRGYYNWYYGNAVNGDYRKPAPALEPLVATGNVGFSYQDSAIRTWLKDTSATAVASTAKVMASLPDVAAVYAKSGSRYRLVSVLPPWKMGRSEFLWFATHAQRLVDTSAAPYGPDLIGLLRDNTTYSIAGDHGGTQPTVQRIPIVFAGAGVGARDNKAEIRSVDIMATVLAQMGIPVSKRLDGLAYALPNR